MSREVARELVAQEIARLRELNYEELAVMVDKPVHETRVGSDGEEYLIETNVFWDSSKGGDVRIMVSGNDKKLLHFMLPDTADFILAPDGHFVGE